jgi:hypothetical protein
LRFGGDQDSGTTAGYTAWNLLVYSSLNRFRQVSVKLGMPITYGEDFAQTIEQLMQFEDDRRIRPW